MFKVVSNHNGANYARPSCLTELSMASRTHGVFRDCPARLRPKHRVHAPE
jgi:hypothetical protein